MKDSFAALDDVQRKFVRKYIHFLPRRKATKEEAAQQAKIYIGKRRKVEANIAALAKAGGLAEQITELNSQITDANDAVSAKRGAINIEAAMEILDGIDNSIRSAVANLRSAPEPAQNDKAERTAYLKEKQSDWTRIRDETRAMINEAHNTLRMAEQEVVNRITDLRSELDVRAASDFNRLFNAAMRNMAEGDLTAFHRELDQLAPPDYSDLDLQIAAIKEEALGNMEALAEDFGASEGGREWTARENQRQEIAQQKITDLNARIESLSARLNDPAVANREDLEQALAGYEDRVSELTAFTQGGPAREQQALELQALLNQSQAQLDNFDQASLSEQAAEIYPNALDDKARAKLITGVADQIAIYRTQFAQSRDQEIWAQKMFPNEPPLTEISQEQLDNLIGQLDKAAAVLNDDPKLGFMLITRANQCWMQFRNGRMALPTPADLKDPRRTKAGMEARLLPLAASLKDCRARIPNRSSLEFEKWQQLTDLFDTLSDDITGAQTPEAAWDFDPRLNQVASEIRSFSDDLGRQTFDKGLFPDDPMTETHQQAVNTSEKISRDLANLTSAKQIKDPALIAKLPADQLITYRNVDTGEVEYYQIAAKELAAEGRTSVTEKIKDKVHKTPDVPHEALAALKTRADLLLGMSGSRAVGCEEEIAAAQQDAAKLLEVVTSDDYRRAFLHLRVTLEDITKVRARKALQEVKPTDLEQLDIDFQILRKGSGKLTDPAPGTANSLMQKLTEAQAEADRIKRDMTALETHAKALAKDHAKLEAKIATILKLQLSDRVAAYGFDDRVMSSNVAALMQMEQSQFDKLKAAFDPVAQDGAELDAAEQQIADAFKAKFTEAKERMDQLISDGRAKAGDIGGPLRKKMESAMRLLDMRTETAYLTAKTTTDGVIAEIKTFNDKISALKQTGHEPMNAEGLKNLATELMASWTGIANTEANADRLRADETSFKATLKTLKKYKFKTDPNGPALEARMRAADAMHKDALKLAKRGDVEFAARKMAAALKDLNAVDAGRSEGGQPWKAPSSLKLATVADRFLNDLKTEAADLVPKVITPLMADAEKQQMAGPLRRLGTLLGSVGEMTDTTPLKSICTTLDAADSQTERRKLREEALSELRSFRARVEASPAITAYRENPFVKVKNYTLLLGALHQTEVAILTSVDPRQA